MKKFFLSLFTVFFVLHPHTAVANTEINPHSTFLNYVNFERSLHGLDPYTENVKLRLAASFKAIDMARYKYWSHNNPVKKFHTPWYFIKASEYNYEHAGENLIRGEYTDSSMYFAFMNSPSHKDNILSENFNEIGISSTNVNYGTYETKVTVVIFGKSQPPAF